LELHSEHSLSVVQ